MRGIQMKQNRRLARPDLILKPGEAVLVGSGGIDEKTAKQLVESGAAFEIAGDALAKLLKSKRQEDSEVRVKPEGETRKK